MKKPIWVPSAERVSSSNMTSFMRYVEELTNRRIGTYDDLYYWSINNPEEFWKSVWIMAGVIHSKPYNSVLKNSVMPGAAWFDGAEFNFAENLLRFRDDNIALISCREGRPNFKITYNRLYEEAAKCASALKKAGVQPGDRVAGYITNIPEAVICMLAAASLGAVWSSCSPEFGVKAVINRFGQIKPKIIFAIESYSYNGIHFNCLDIIQEFTSRIEGVEKVIILPEYNDFAGSCIENTPDILSNYMKYKDFTGYASTKIEFQQMPFNAPLYIMYSSGTTGNPKCIVHGAGGTLLQHFKELSLHTNLTRNDTIIYYTNCGWMMWNWLVSALNIGARVLLYDGSPVYPDKNILWRLIETEKVTVFGTSPAFISICEKEKVNPEGYDLTSLETILSTGSPLSEESFRWIYSNVKDDVQLSSISGGTDILSCFMLGNPNLPVYEGEIQCRGLGMKVEAYNSEGRPVIEEKGELVCTAPFPSMPVFFWDDPGGSKYKSSYFEYYPGIWRHGDYIKITRHGGVIVYGRSDATLNPGGVRIGTAEIYSVVEAMEEISDSLAAGQNLEDDVRVILFVLLKEGFHLTQELKQRIKDEIKNSATPRHVPKLIFEVKGIPKTINGKKVELAVWKLLNGEKVENTNALANPEVLDEFRKIVPLLQD
jgi:acetoacetyl-CoA synthetase